MIVAFVVIESWLMGLAATVVGAIHATWRLSRLSIIDPLPARE